MAPPDWIEPVTVPQPWTGPGPLLSNGRHDGQAYEERRAVAPVTERRDGERPRRNMRRRGTEFVRANRPAMPPYEARLVRLAVQAFAALMLRQGNTNDSAPAPTPEEIATAAATVVHDDMVERCDSSSSSGERSREVATDNRGARDGASESLRGLTFGLVPSVRTRGTRGFDHDRERREFNTSHDTFLLSSQAPTFLTRFAHVSHTLSGVSPSTRGARASLPVVSPRTVILCSRARRRASPAAAAALRAFVRVEDEVRLLDPADDVPERHVERLVRPGRAVLLDLALPLPHLALLVLALEDVHGLRDQGFHSDPRVDVDVVPVELGVQHKDEIIPVADSRGALLTAVRIAGLNAFPLRAGCRICGVERGAVDHDALAHGPEPAAPSIRIERDGIGVGCVGYVGSCSSCGARHRAVFGVVTHEENLKTKHDVSLVAHTRVKINSPCVCSSAAGAGSCGSTS